MILSKRYFFPVMFLPMACTITTMVFFVGTRYQFLCDIITKQARDLLAEFPIQRQASLSKVDVEMTPLCINEIGVLWFSSIWQSTVVAIIFLF